MNRGVQPYFQSDRRPAFGAPHAMPSQVPQQTPTYTTSNVPGVAHGNPSHPTQQAAMATRAAPPPAASPSYNPPSMATMAPPSATMPTSAMGSLGQGGAHAQPEAVPASAGTESRPAYAPSTRYDPDEAEARVRSLIADTEKMLAGLSTFSGGAEKNNSNTLVT
eukprot:CAMPEP_0184300564 /NCGR_PEP_ID=MMETSP1049-20130417/10959_1 /TAXON_ID=77928 /ORGANISM="Proteomonas sulcata, Strain CCMP704" /LENGTH=163 /DNA_ID=CAMNT_0026611323 /DNA_START=120 /DNA_END=611 /DNA_ORIENTATION=-